MPLSSVNLTTLKGLFTEASEIDPAKRPPNSLIDCVNVAFPKDGSLTARKGYPVVLDATAVSNGKIFYGIQETALNTGYQIYNVDASGRAQTAYWTGSATSVVSASSVVAISGYDASGVGVEYTDITPFSSSYWTITPYPNYSQLKITPKFVNFNNTWYFMADNGLYRELDGSSGAKFSKVMLPGVYTFDNSSVTNELGASSSTASEDKAWLQTGNTVSMVATVVTYINDETPVESEPSAPVEFTNLKRPDAVRVSGLSISNFLNVKNLNNVFVRVYRTKQYNKRLAKETEYYLCYEKEVVAGGGGISTALNISIPYFTLDLNDDSISAQEKLYTSVNVDGAEGTNDFPPAANCLTQYKGYAVYGDIYRAPFQKFTAVKLPTTGERLYYYSGTGTYLTLDSFTNSTGAPSTDGYLDATSITYRGTPSATDYPLVIRPENPTGTHIATAYSVPFYAQTPSGLTFAGTGPTRTVKVLASTGAIFDLNQFQAPGIMAVVSSTGTVLDIFAYRDFEYIPTSTYCEFYECTSLTNFTAATGAATYYIYYLPGTTVENLDIYPIGSDATGSLTKGFSLLPTYETYPTYPYWQATIGRLSGVKNATGIKANPVFYGPLWKNTVTRLDEAVKYICQQLPYFKYAGPFTFEVRYKAAGAGINNVSYDGSSDFPNTNAMFDAVYLYKQATGTFDCDIALGTTATNLAEKAHIPNGIVFSKLGRPEEVPYRFTRLPVKVGRDNNAITYLATNLDNLYVFKKDEGIFRVEIVGGTSIPTESDIVQIDNTFWPVQENAFAEGGSVIFFLSNRGIEMFSGGQSQVISSPIECDIRDRIVGNSADTKSVKAFYNDFLKQVGFYFPDVNKTYVYDIGAGEWSIWDLPFDAAFTDSQHRLMFASRGHTPATGASAWSVLRRNSYLGGGWFDPPSQYDDILPFTGLTVSASGTALTLSATGARTNRFTPPNNAMDFYDSAKDYAFYIGSNGAASGSTLYPVTFSSTGASSVVFDISAVPASAATGINTTWGLAIGVPTSYTHNRYFVSGPSSLSRFAEYHLQMAGTFSNIEIGFECDNATPTFVNSSFLTYSSFSDKIRTLIPRQQSRGRWIMAQVRHGKPYECFTVNGFAYVANNMGTFRVTRKANT